MLALFCKADGQLFIVESEITTLPPDPASDPQGRVYALRSMTAITVDAEPQIFCLYEQVQGAEELRAIRMMPLPIQADQA